MISLLSFTIANELMTFFMYNIVSDNVFDVDCFSLFVFVFVARGELDLVGEEVET